MILLWLLCLCDWANAQDCWPLQHDNQSHHGTIFGDITNAKGIVLGNLAVGGSAGFTELSAGVALSSDADWALLIRGDLAVRCGDVEGQVFHGGLIDVGARVDWHGYVASNANIGSMYEFSGAEEYYKGLSLNLGLLDKRGYGTAQLQTVTLALSGNGRANEMFFVTCEDLANARAISFSNINVADSTTVIINAAGADCSIDIRFNAIAGLNWTEPTGHILWNFFEAKTLSLTRSVVGSILAPNAEVVASQAYVEGQVIVQSLTGEFYFGAKLFRGCVPTDPCTAARSTCTIVEIPTGCNAPVPVPDPNDDCCIISYKCEECPSVCPTADDLQCNPRFRSAIQVTSPNDPCCDTFACIEVDGVTENDPLSISCPRDFDVKIPVGGSQIDVTWETPEFLYVQSVSSSHTSPTTFGSGEHVIHYTAVGLKPNTFVGCYFAVNVIATSFSSGCNVGGVSYGEGEQFLDSCMKQCICGSKGTGVFCTRVRKELGSMNTDERARYWDTYKSAYNHHDRIIQNHVDNHLRFFSRGLHNNGAFLPWHRGYILQIENRLQQEDCKVTVPYWNWRLAPRINLANHWGNDDHHASGNGDNRRCVTTGTFGFSNGFALTSGTCLQRRIGGGTAATLSTIQAQIFERYPRASQYDQMRNRLEHGPGMHDSVHCLVGGTMCSARASNDPVFFTHHANIDKIWSEWQALGDEHLNFYTGSTDQHALMPTSPWTPRQMMLLHNQPGDVRVIYYEDDVIITLNNVLGMMTPTERDRLGRPAVGPVGEEWLVDMNLNEQDIDTIRLAEKLANSNVILDAVMMTMKNAVERTVEAADLLNTIRQVAARTAIHLGDSKKGQEVTADALFRALTEAFVKSNVVPRFLELQDIILTAEDGAVIDVVPIAVPIECAPDSRQVCASGMTFPNSCEAQQSGYDVYTFGACPLPPAPLPPIDPAIDGGDSLAYNHAIQELMECPDNLNFGTGDECPTVGLTCLYGLSCCDSSEVTATCRPTGQWFIVDLRWNSCASVPSCNSAPVEPQSSANVQIPTRPPTPAITRRPTRRPTNMPTRRPTNRPTRSPTRSQSISRPIPNNPAGSRNSLPPPNPPRAINPSSTRRPLSASSSHIQSTSRPRIIRSVSNSLPSTPLLPPLIIPTPVCPTSPCESPPTCCGIGAALGQPPILNTAGEVCSTGCSTCMISGRQAPVPECCRGIRACAMITCLESERAVILIPKGANGEAPCCDRYQCQSKDNPCLGTVCPTLETAICANRLSEVPRFVTQADTTHSLEDPLGCCRNIICVAAACQTDTRLCLDGTLLTRSPTSTPACQFESCPVICPDHTLRLFCPASGGALVARDRNSAEHTQSCEWQPCPPYEPCSDLSFGPDPCGSNGQCIRGLSVLSCNCVGLWSGPRCTVAATPVRSTHVIHDKSVLMAHFREGPCFFLWCAPVPGSDFSSCYALDTMSPERGTQSLEASVVSLMGSVGSGTLEQVFFLNEDGELTSWDEAGVLFSDSSLDDNFKFAVDNSNFSAAITEFSYFELKDGNYPPNSEARHILNVRDYCPDVSWTGVSTTAIFLSHEKFVLYTTTDDNKVVQHVYKWSTPLADAETFDVCPDLCVNDEGERNTCNGNGICVRETNVCLCNFGWRGESCQSAVWTGLDEP